jgi:DNA polymerase-4
MLLHDEFNAARPLVMHIDLNSCFATVEQQSRPMLRDRPVAVVNRRTENTAIVTASYEAKRLDVSVGMKLREAKKLAPDLVALESDPAKYRYVYHKMMDIMKRYSAHIAMKSIDEGVIDFKHTTAAIQGRDLRDIGMEIKQCLRDEVGNYMRCNVGIATNRFLAKTAASLHKPDGLDIITHENIRDVMASLKLTELTGIAHRFQTRLNAVGIYTPTDFLATDAVTLRKVVFKSVVGEWWYQRLRGWEVDDVSYDLKTVGRQYVLEERDMPKHLIIQRLHHLCESVGMKLRSQHKQARGVFVYAKSGHYPDRSYWHARHTSPMPFFSNAAIYAQALLLFANAPEKIREIGVSCYALEDGRQDQLSLFGDEMAREQQLTDAIDAINCRFGDRTIHSADTVGTSRFVKQKIPFGSTRFL